jgi:hypothetical protein
MYYTNYFLELSFYSFIFLYLSSSYMSHYYTHIFQKINILIICYILYWIHENGAFTVIDPPCSLTFHGGLGRARSAPVCETNFEGETSTT